MTAQDYLNLITSEYQDSTNFMAMISLDVSPMVQVQSLLNSMLNIFDLSQNPVGNQLDIIGQWVGISRQVSLPIVGVFFTWDDTAADGWDAGSWAPIGNPTNIISLPDATYLTLIRAKIAANSWDGTVEQFYTILEEAFPQYGIILLDHQDMSYSLGIIGNPVDSLTLALFTGGYIPVRPEGVMVDNYFTNADTNPIFAWDMSGPGYAGWDSGSWVKEFLPT